MTSEILRRLRRMDWSYWLTAPVWVPLRVAVAAWFWGRQLALLPLYLLIGGTVGDWWADTTAFYRYVYETRPQP